MLLYNLVAVVLYFIPHVVAQVLRACGRARQAWEVALDIPATVAVDFLLILVLARAMRLESAVLVARGIWIAGGVAGYFALKKRGMSPTAPLGIDRRAVVAVATAAALAVGVSMTMSRVYRVWDRYWHIPLTSTISGQSLPFENVYQPGQVLHYHWMGDVWAATFKTLSFLHLSSDVGLVLVHDVTFGLIGATIALLMIAFGQRGMWAAILGGVATVLQGPLPLRGGLGNHLDGYAYHNFLTNSLRPHVAIAGLLMTGFIGALAVRLRFTNTPHKRTYLVMLAIITLMGVTDEPSSGMLLGSLGVAWLLYPEVVAPTRVAGVVAMVLLGVAFLLPNFAFGGSVAPGSPVQTLKWVEPAVPGAHTEIPIFKMWSHEGNLVLFNDFFPFLACTIGVTLAMRSEGMRRFSAAAAFCWTMIVLAFIAQTRLEVNGLRAVEVQRYFVAPFFASYVLGLTVLHRLERGSFASIAIVGGVSLAAISTVFWVREQLPKELGYAEHDRKWNGMMEDTMTSDCVETTGMRFGEHPRLMYVESSVWYLWVSCHGVFQPGWRERTWATRAHPTGEGKPLEQLRQVHTEMAAQSETIPAACLQDATRSDVVCNRARAHSSCEKQGTLFELCKLTPEDRAALLSGR